MKRCLLTVKVYGNKKDGMVLFESMAKCNLNMLAEHLQRQDEIPKEFSEPFHRFVDKFTEILKKHSNERKGKNNAGRLDFIKRVLEKRKEFYASMADFHEENGNEKYQTANLYAYHEVCTILRLLTTEDADEVYNAEHQFDKEF